MTLEFDSQNNTREYSQGDLPALNTGDANQLTGAMDMQKRDRFELLSAYLDGEVTAAERRQVEEWLVNAPEAQCLYARLLKLRQGLQTMPVPPVQQAGEDTAKLIFARLNKRPKIAVVWGGAAIAAMFIGSFLGVPQDSQSQLHQLAQSSQPVTPENLMVALNTPVVAIPKLPYSDLGKSLKPTQSPQQPSNQNVN